MKGVLGSSTSYDQQSNKKARLKNGYKENDLQHKFNGYTVLYLIKTNLKVYLGQERMIDIIEIV